MTAPPAAQGFKPQDLRLEEKRNKRKVAAPVEKTTAGALTTKTSGDKVNAPPTHVFTKTPMVSTYTA